MPTCSKCKTELPRTEFYKRSGDTERINLVCKACCKKRSREWVEKNADRVRENVARWHKEHPEQVRGYKRAYQKRNPNQLHDLYELHKEDRKLKERARVRKLRTEMMEAYGGKCECCGEWRYEFLTLEHKNGDGAEHRRKEVSNMRIMRKLREEGWPKDNFTVLCLNCNSAKFWYDICPHERERQDGLHSSPDS